MRYPKDFLNEKYKQLPEVVKDAMGSVDRANLIRSIAEKHKLHVDLAGLLLEEIMYVTLGVEKSSDFIRNLKLHLHLPEDKVSAVAGDVNEKIFMPIREALKEAGAEPVQSTESEIKPATTYNSDDLRKKEVELENQINHPQLTESEETNVPINTEQEVKPEAPVPANLPVEEEVKKVGQEVGKERHIQKQSPYAKDPYREPIE